MEWGLALWRAAAHYRQGRLQRSPAVSRRRAARWSRRSSVLFSALQCAFSTVQCSSVFSVRSGALWCSSVSVFVAASLLSALGNSRCSLRRVHAGGSFSIEVFRRGRREELVDKCRHMQAKADECCPHAALPSVGWRRCGRRAVRCVPAVATEFPAPPAVKSPGTWSFLVLWGGHQWGALDGFGGARVLRQRQKEAAAKQAAVNHAPIQAAVACFRRQPRTNSSDTVWK